MCRAVPVKAGASPRVGREGGAPADGRTSDAEGLRDAQQRRLHGTAAEGRPGRVRWCEFIGRLAPETQQAPGLLPWAWGSHCPTTGGPEAGLSTAKRGPGRSPQEQLYLGWDGPETHKS